MTVCQFTRATFAAIVLLCTSTDVWSDSLPAPFPSKQAVDPTNTSRMQGFFKQLLKELEQRGSIKTRLQFLQHLQTTLSTIQTLTAVEQALLSEHIQHLIKFYQNLLAKDLKQPLAKVKRLS